MSYTLALLIATTFWSAHGVQSTCTPVITHAEASITGYSFMVDAYADPETCTITLDPVVDYQPSWYRCSTVVHEVGHLWGLSHSKGVMESPYGGYLPQGCDRPLKFRKWWHKRNVLLKGNNVRGWKYWNRVNFYP